MRVEAAVRVALSVHRAADRQRLRQRQHGADGAAPGFQQLRPSWGMNGGSYDVPTTRARRTCRAAAVRAAACASAAYSAPPPRISCRRRRRGGDPPPPLFGDSGHAGGQQLPKDGSLDSQKLHAPRTQCGAAIPGVGVRLGHAQRVHAPGLAPMC